jgi:dipeptidyl-peptidase III
LVEIQRIKSTGDYAAAQAIVEDYAVKVDQKLHTEVLERYAKLNIAPYKGFVNPVYKASFDKTGKFTGLSIDYTEGYAEQHLRYSKEYSPLTK